MPGLAPLVNEKGKRRSFLIPVVSGLLSILIVIIIIIIILGARQRLRLLANVVQLNMKKGKVKEA